MAEIPPLVVALGQRLIARKDVKAWQSPDGQWFPAQEKMTMADFDAHLAGTHTMGHYLIRPGENIVKFFAFDIDLVKFGGADEPMFWKRDGSYHVFDPRAQWKGDTDYGPEAQVACVIALRKVSEELARLANRLYGLHVAIHDSGGKGFHVYVFTDEIPASAARELANSLLEGSGMWTPTRGNNFWRHRNPMPEALEGLVEIEVFPKQDEVEEGGYGNLMKLPCGRHQATKAMTRFLSTRCSLDEMVEMDPLAALTDTLPWEA